ncbi:DUF4258 domain-containing protein [Candidatus Parcubacteria bacterium]|nr:DUF4258 domain-containing protein [Candidatus Parcubacteria bacterium]
MDLEIKFSSHALERMAEREISAELVKKAIRFADKIEKSSVDFSRVLAKKLYFNEKLKKDHLLLIIFEVKQDSINVITIIDTSKISKYF